MSFEPQPLFPAFSFRGCEIQIGPSPRSVYQCARFKLAGCGHDSERTGAGDTLHRDLLSRVDAGAFGRTPECGVEVKACDAGGGRIYSSLKSTSVEEEACFRNAHCVPQQGCMIVIKKFCEQVEGFSRDKFAAHFVAGKSAAFEQQDTGTAAGGRDGRGSACWTAADDDEIVMKHSALSYQLSAKSNVIYLLVFHAITPTRNR